MFACLLIFQLFQMLVVNVICPRNVFLVPSVVSCLVSAAQQNCCAARIERINNAVRASFMLNPEFAHTLVARCLNPGGVGHL